MKINKHFVIALILSFLACFSALAQAQNKPKLSIANPIYDFGSVPEGTKVNASFVVKNTGNSDLVIEKVVPGCGCTASTATNTPIQPGKTGKIDATFDTSGFAGEKFKSIRVYTNDPDAPTSLVSLKGVVEVDINIEPPRLFFGDISKGQPLSKDFKISVRKGSKVKIGELKLSSPSLKLEEISSSADGLQKNYRITLSADLPIGEFRDRIIVNLSEGKRQSFNIPVFASVHGPLELDPSTISFGVVESGQGASLTRKVKFINKSNREIKITKIVADSPAITSSFKALAKSNNYIIEINLDPKKLNSNLKGMLKVHTDNTDEPELSMNVFAVLAPKVK